MSAMAATLRAMLAEGDRRTVGRVEEVVALVGEDVAGVEALVDLLWDESAAVRMRAADALEKLSRSRAELLQPYRSAFLTSLAEAEQQEVRWHLAVLVPRLRLTQEECGQVAEQLRLYLNDKSSIVKALSMQGLADLTRQNEDLRPAVVDLLRALTRSGTPAMRARGRKLLHQLEQG